MSQRTNLLKSCEDIKKILVEALDQRGRVYEKISAMTVYWERDDSGGEGESRAFADMAKFLGVSDACVHEISAADKVPGWTLERAVMSWIEEADDKDGRTLLIFHYTGHAMIDNHNTLQLCPDRKGSKLIPYQRHIGDNLLEPTSNYAFFGKIDAVVILDACHSGAAVRGGNIRRSSELVTATTDEELVCCSLIKAIKLSIAINCSSLHSEGIKFLFTIKHYSFYILA
ncbi:MAG: hypothetical protein MMC33_005391 [Icmadophila ericetorum]|nr:hypothetical protein [Icmadophila ericetorum]